MITLTNLYVRKVYEVVTVAHAGVAVACLTSSASAKEIVVHNHPKS